MNLQAVNKLLVGGAAALAVSFILTLTCTFIYGWAEIDTAAVEATYGLWKACVTVSGSDEDCDDIPDAPGWLKAARGLMISGVSQIGVALFMTVYFMIKTKLTGEFCKRSITFGILLNGCLATTMVTIVHIMYGAEYEDDFGDDAELAHAFGLSVTSSALILTGTLLVFFSYRQA